MLLKSQKIVGSFAGGVGLNLPRCRVELEEVLFHIFPNLKNCSHIPTSVTVIRSTKHRHYIFILTPIITFHHKLVSSRNQSKPISMIELACYILAKSITSSTR
uniref:Uncharacterized protein n=1 Tax=Opuntia streptacantha TaxID=393608 RepID=A0A7C9CPQ8_OPUST